MAKKSKTQAPALPVTDGEPGAPENTVQPGDQLDPGSEGGEAPEETSTDVLREVSQIDTATTAQLVNTYNKLTGKTIKKFSSREAGKRQVEMAMLAAKDADGHLGVPKGAEGEVKTAEELAEKADEKGQPAPNMNPDPEARPTFPPGSMADQLQKAGEKKEPITPREPKAKGTPVTPRNNATHVVGLPGEGKSKVRDSSQRGAVHMRIKSFKDDKGNFQPVAIKDLNSHFQIETKGYIQKLLEKDHIALCDEAGNIIAGTKPD